MDHFWRNKTGIVTGAASGIGLALSKALSERGAHVWMADLDGEGVTRVASNLGTQAHPISLDVRDAGAVRNAVETVIADAGRIDFIFNNAGIGIGGEVHEFTTEHFDRIVDINIRGVVNGVVAASPIMVRQRAGLIVNTASLAGLAPTPLLTPYAMTKHAIIGLSSSLRAEAAQYGVQVSALCPAAIETPMLDAGNPSDLPQVSWICDVRRYLQRLAGPPVSAERFVKSALRGVERNRGLIIYPSRARLVARLQRYMPGLVRAVGQRALKAELASRPRDS